MLHPEKRERTGTVTEKVAGKAPREIDQSSIDKKDFAASSNHPIATSIILEKRQRVNTRG